jgi:hypothetical protein
MSHNLFFRISPTNSSPVKPSTSVITVKLNVDTFINEGRYSDFQLFYITMIRCNSEIKKFLSKNSQKGTLEYPSKRDPHLLKLPVVCRLCHLKPAVPEERRGLFFALCFLCRRKRGRKH